MKTPKIIILAALIVFSFTTNAQDKKKTEEITIKTSVVCNMCKYNVEKAMAYEKGVKKSNVKVQEQTVTILFDPKKTSPEKIKKAITMAGYDADEMLADPKAYEKLDACCKKDNEVHE
ncbi:MAG: heavy-metal-associated domain-containing protein [Bacteroidetes bacterium]|nr:heavy-metal-associated domain-containing protein [Bacteroidota bacterium]HET6245615.1 heavy metal-associated domain-containing protein [Bacteroidia bacterium]